VESTINDHATLTDWTCFIRAEPFPKPPGGGIIMSMGFSVDGLLLAAGDNKGAAHIWIKKPAGYVECLARAQAGLI